MILSILFTRLIRRWRLFVFIGAPIIFLPLVIVINTPESKCAYVFLLVITYWISSAIPLAVASLLPIVLFPIFGILPSDKISLVYMKDTNVMLLASITAAIAIENCNLHRRVALRILLLAGTSPKWLMLSFMGTTAFLSMWISNTASTSLMVPIVESILQELSTLEMDELNNEKTNNDGIISTHSSNINLVQCTVMETQVDSVSLRVPESTAVSTESLKRRASVVAEKMARYRKGTLLSVAYASNFGGSTTITGTGTNLVLMELLNSRYQGAKTGLTFATWMLFALPCAGVCLVLSWLWLQIVFLGPRSLCESNSKESRLRVKNVIRRQYKEMGAMNFHQAIILTLFTLLVLLWVFRRPEFIPGWASFFPPGYVSDTVAGVGIIILMFAVPSRADFFCSDCSQDEPPPPALNWPIVQKKMPWNILLLMGGGFALAKGSKESGLSKWVGEHLKVLSPLPPIAIVTILTIGSALVTEVASNTATATILMPVLSDISESIRVHPIYLMLPAAIACSFAFMFPIATPPNAIVFEVCGMKTCDMVKPGIVTNIISLTVLLLMINTLGVYLFNLNEYPSWTMQRVVINNTCYS